MSPMTPGLPYPLGSSALSASCHPPRSFSRCIAFAHIVPSSWGCSSLSLSACGRNPTDATCSKARLGTWQARSALPSVTLLARECGTCRASFLQDITAFMDVVDVWRGCVFRGQTGLLAPSLPQQDSLGWEAEPAASP